MVTLKERIEQIIDYTRNQPNGNYESRFSDECNGIDYKIDIKSNFIVLMLRNSEGDYLSYSRIRCSDRKPSIFVGDDITFITGDSGNEIWFPTAIGGMLF